MKTRIYIAILTLILLAGIIIIYRSPPPDVVVQEVAATMTVPAVVVVETVASTVEAIIITPTIITTPGGSITVVAKKTELTTIPILPLTTGSVSKEPLPSSTSGITKENQVTVFPTYTSTPTTNLIQGNKPKATLTSPAQIQVDQPAPAPLPTVVSITTQNLQTTNTLTNGLKIVYAETDGQAGVTKIWMSNVVELGKRQLLIEVSHKVGYPSSGNLSPDGNLLLYNVVPINLTENEAYRGNRELWVLDIRDGTRKKLPEIINGFIKWLPDSQTLIYSQNKYDNIGNVEINVYTTSIVDLSKQNLVFSTNSFAFAPIWFPDNQTMFYIEEKNDFLTEVQALDLYSGKTRFIHIIDVPQPWNRYSISSDGTTMLIVKLDTNLTGGIYSLITISLVTGEKKIILTYPYEENNNPIYYIDTRWLPDNQRFLVYFPPRKNQPAQLNLVNLTKTPLLQSVLSNTSFLNQSLDKGNNVETSLLPGIWSPDGKWLTLLYYPNIGQEIYVLDVNTNKMSRIPTISKSHGIYVIGWIR